MFDIQTKKNRKERKKENKKKKRKKKLSPEIFVEINLSSKSISPFQKLDNNPCRFIRYDLYRSYISFPNV